MEIYFKGGDTQDISRFEPAQLPTMSDTVIFDQCTEDVVCNGIPMWGSLKLTNFLGTISYCIPSKQLGGTVKNSELHTIFLFMTHIKRVD